MKTTLEVIAKVHLKALFRDFRGILLQVRQDVVCYGANHLEQNGRKARKVPKATFAITSLSFLCLCVLSLLASAEIIPEALPEVIELHHASIVQRLRDFPDHASRVEFLRQEKAKESSMFFPKDNAAWGDKVFRSFQPAAITFRWQCTENETGPFCVEISESPDFTDAQTHIAPKDWNKGVWHPYYTLYTYFNSLKIGTRYYWRVLSYDLKQAGNPAACSATQSFTTQDLPPRHICLEHNYPCEGRETNFRDMGGWMTLDGRRVRQGLAFRSAAFDSTSTDTIHPGRIHIGLGDQEFLLNTLKLKSDIDLRSAQETANAPQSPLGSAVQYFPCPVPSYAGAFTADGKAKFGAAFHLLANPDNYPLVFHCVGGADRTATLAIFLNGLLGVSRKDLECDWECTFLPDLPCLQNNCERRCCSLVFRELEKYGTPEDTLAKRIEIYLLDCGVTEEEIRAIRKLYLEP